MTDMAERTGEIDKVTIGVMPDNGNLPLALTGPKPVLKAALKAAEATPGAIKDARMFKRRFVDQDAGIQIWRYQGATILGRGTTSSGRGSTINRFNSFVEQVVQLDQEGEIDLQPPFVPRSYEKTPDGFNFEAAVMLPDDANIRKKAFSIAGRSTTLLARQILAKGSPEYPDRRGGYQPIVTHSAEDGYFGIRGTQAGLNKDVENGQLILSGLLQDQKHAQLFLQFGAAFGYVGDLLTRQVADEGLST